MRLARYNWPLYAAGTVAVLGGVAVASWSLPPPPVRWVAALGAAVAAWFACASFLAFHWMFDRSEFTRWQWLPRLLGQAPARWVHISAALAETNAPLPELFPGTEGKVLDIFDPGAMTEPAIARARQQRPDAAAIRARMDALPVEDRWADGVFVVLAAHEIRNRSDRERFFLELRRIVSEQGRIVLVEHPRNLAGALAFGPGVMHFLPRGEWLRLARLAALEVEGERSFTPFVRVFVCRR